MGKYIIGIDLGTTNSAVTIYENGQPKIIENAIGKRTTPSVVAFKKSKDKKTGDIKEEWLVGESAKNQAVTNSLNTIYGVKRLIGRRFDDPEVGKMKELAPYKIVEGPSGDAWVEVNGKAMAPAEISANVLRTLKKAVEEYLGKDADGKQIEVNEAVITVPAYFNDSQRQATKDAGKIAGLDVKRIINEPTAAALAYGMDKKESGKTIIYDLGGGTFDVSVLDMQIDEKDGSMVEVLATNGNTFLGGENFDERIIDHLVDVLKNYEDEDGNESGVDIRATKNVVALQRLKEAAEKAKIELSTQHTSEINLPIIAQKADGTIVNFSYQMTRGKLEELVQDLVDKTVEPCKQALADAGLKISDIDEVILVGGQTRMPKVVDTVRKFFGKEPRKDVNPDEIVSMGASIQGAILDGKVEGVLLFDVIPLSIGIRTAGDVMEKMIPRNSSIPTEVKETFTTAEDNQPNVHVVVYQGEREKASTNKKLGEFTMRLPPGTKKGTPIEVSFNIDADGVLGVEAKNGITGQAQKITVKANGGLSEDEVARMLKDAEKNAEADRIFRERQMAPLHAEELLKEAALDTGEDYFKAAPAELQESFRAAVKELTEAVTIKDVAVMVEKTAKLKEIRIAIGEAFNNAAQNAAPVPPQEEAPKAEPTAKDAPKGPAAP